VDRGRGAGIVGESEMKGVTGKGTADFPLLHCKMDPQGPDVPLHSGIFCQAKRHSDLFLVKFTKDPT
jgi:hypothetical protein